MTRFPKGALVSLLFSSSFSSASFRERRILSLSLSLSLQTALFFSLSREMLNASAVVPRAFACSKYVRARVTREEALLEEKRKDGRERWKNFYLLLVLCTFYEGVCRFKVK